MLGVGIGVGLQHLRSRPGLHPPPPGFERLYVRKADLSGFEPFQVRKPDDSGWEDFMVRANG